MDSRGDALANTYAINPIAPVAPVAQEAYNDGIEPLQGLQHVQGITEDYYKKVAALKSFMQDAHQNYGLDVRVPDLSRPESIKMNKIYQTALADIMAQGNMLKNSQSQHMINTQMNQQYAPGVDTTKTPEALLRQGTDVYSRQLEGPVTETNDKNQMATQTKEEYDQKMAIFEGAKAHYDDLIKQHPERAAYYEYQKSGLVAPTKGDWRPNNQYTAGDRAWGRAVFTAGNNLKKIVNLQEGAHSSYKPSSSALNSEGHPMLISNEYYGKKFGDKMLDHWEHDPDTNKTYIVFQGNNTPIEITGDDPRSIVTAVTGADSGALAEYAQKNGYEDEFGDLKRHALLGKDYQLAKDAKKKESVSLHEELVKPTIKELWGKISELDPHKWNPLVDGDEVQVGKFVIQRNGDKLNIKNFRQVVSSEGYTKDEYKSLLQKSSFTADEAGKKALLDFLVKQNAHADYFKSKLNTQSPTSGTQVAPTSTGQSQEELAARAAAIKAKYGAK